MKKNKTEIVNFNDSLTKISNQLRIGDSLLITNRNKETIAFVKQLTKNFDIKNAKRQVLINFSFSESFLDRNQTELDWSALSSNKNLPWSEDFFDKHKDKWDFGSLSSNRSVPWSIELITKYENKWDWEELTHTTGIDNIELNEKLIDKHKDEIDFESLSYNEKLPWSIDFIEKYEDKWDWESLSQIDNIELNEELIDNHIDEINWGSLAHNEKLPWSLDFIKKYEDRWEDVDIVYKHLKSEEENKEESQDTKDFFELSRSLDFDWNENVVEKYKNELYWDILSMNPKLPWSLSFIEKYEQFIDWRYLGWNIGIEWTEKLIDKYIDKWDWKYLSSNPALPWSIEFMDKYNEKLIHDYLVWSKNLILDSPVFSIDELELHRDFGVFDYKIEVDLDFFNKFKNEIIFFSRGLSTHSFICSDVDWRSNVFIENKDLINWRQFFFSHRYCWHNKEFLEKYIEYLLNYLDDKENFGLYRLIFKKFISNLREDAVLELLKDSDFE